MLTDKGVSLFRMKMCIYPVHAAAYNSYVQTRIFICTDTMFDFLRTFLL